MTEIRTWTADEARVAVADAINERSGIRADPGSPLVVAIAAALGIDGDVTLVRGRLEEADAAGTLPMSVQTPPLTEVEYSPEAPLGLACPQHGPVQYHDEGMPFCLECEPGSLNSAGRTPAEEAIVRYRYYLGIAANFIDRHCAGPVGLLLEHKYLDPAAVLRELEAALDPDQPGASHEPLYRVVPPQAEPGQP